jgi:L-ascorbate metabolism protein UlaG (beta-lactamase superfamily)
MKIQKSKSQLKNLIIFIIITLIVSACCSFDGSSYKGQVSDHFDGKQFHNQESGAERNFWDFLKWQATYSKGNWDDWWDDPPGPKPAERVNGDSLVVTFINHATVLIQTNGINILTDPVWSESISPMPFTGFERHRPPGIRFEDLPPVDIVLISHNHFDHLDIPTLKRLKDAFNPLFLVGLGNKGLLDEEGLTNSIELDWWQEKDFKNDIKITYVPSRHFSMRGICDKDATLWGGYVIQTKGGPIYFAGDTGFGIHFKQIYDKFGPMRLSFLPIAPIKPEWIMREVHESPADAVKAHKILHSKTSIAIHWGTFSQAEDGMLDAVLDLESIRKKEGISRKEFIIPRHGRGIVVK